MRAAIRAAVLPPTCVTIGAILAVVFATPALAAAPPPTDPMLARLLEEALASRPEVARGRSLVEASRERISQVGALPDPMLSVGVQNDGFTRIEVGRMETSYLSLMASQTFPWPGKLGFREDVARSDAAASEAALLRARLDVEAEVRTAWVEWLLAREQLELLRKLEQLWAQSEEIARTRYEVGETPQSDLLRAQLQRTRLRQQRVELEAGLATRLQTLNRATGRPLSEPLDATGTLSGLQDPAVPLLAEALEDAEARSPELLAARAGVTAASSAARLARREPWPDLNVGAGVMVRGAMPPMWQVSVGVPLPVYAGRKQVPAIREADARSAAESGAAEAVLQVLRLRTQERLSLLGAFTRTNELYRRGLLVQSEATTQSTLAQYQVGRVPFASVLEALGGYLADEGGFLESLAQVQRLAIDQWTLRLDPPAAVGGAMASPSMPGASRAMPSGPRGAASSTGAAPAAARSGGGMGM